MYQLMGSLSHYLQRVFYIPGGAGFLPSAVLKNSWFVDCFRDGIYTLHHIMLHSIVIHCIVIHYFALHYFTLHYITLPYITLFYTTILYILTVHCQPIDTLCLDSISLWNAPPPPPGGAFCFLSLAGSSCGEGKSWRFDPSAVRMAQRHQSASPGVHCCFHGGFRK